MTVPKDIAEIRWKEPWWPVQPGEFGARLAKEVGRNHVLYGRKAICIGRRHDTDDALYFLPDGPALLAVVHLTWSSQTPEPNPQIPWTDLYHSVQDFIDRRMIPDADEITQSGGTPNDAEER